MIVVNGKEFTSLEQDIFIGGKKVIEAYAGNRLVYPTETFGPYEWDIILTWKTNLNLRLHVGLGWAEPGNHLNIYHDNPSVNEGIYKAKYFKQGKNMERISFDAIPDEIHIIVYDVTNRDSNNTMLYNSGVTIKAYYKGELINICTPEGLGPNGNTWSAYHIDNGVAISERRYYGFNSACYYTGYTE